MNFQGFENCAEEWREVHNLLDTKEKCILWMCYIHVTRFKVIPQQLYDPANQMSGRIVTKVIKFLQIRNKYKCCERIFRAPPN